MRIILLICFLSCFCATHGIYPCAPTSTSSCELRTGDDLRHPEQVLSRHNILEMELEVEMSRVTVGGWLELWRRTYNGNIGGPTWRVKPGDTISVNLVNKLGPNLKQTPLNSLGKPNSTNLYVHGLHVSPKNNDATIVVEPGEKKNYVHNIGCDHPPGTYWYHPHVHGSAMFQTFSGMAGMIVVEDDVTTAEDPQSISHYSCPAHCEREVQLLFQPTLLYKIGLDGFSFARVQSKIGDPDAFRNREKMYGRRTVEDWLIGRQNKVSHFTTNGQIQPTIRIEAGKTMRFRMVNAGGIYVLEIETPSSSLTGKSCQVEEIARDGIYFTHPQKPMNGKSVLPQGGTMDWLIKCDSPGVFQIKSKPDMRMYPGIGRAARYEGLLAQIEVIQKPVKTFLKAAMAVANFEEEVPIVLPSLPKYMPNLRLLPPNRVTGKYVVETCANNLINRAKYNGSDTVVSYQIPLGGVEEWTLLNADPTNSHTIHIQGNHFQIVSFNPYYGPVSITTRAGIVFVDHFRRLCQVEGPTPSTLSLKKAGVSTANYRPYKGKGIDPFGHWRNTIIVPPLANMTIRFMPRQFVGKAMVFSQNLLRDDFGMKMMIQFVEKGRKSVSRMAIPEAGLPGTCRPGDFYPAVQQQTKQNSKKIGKGDFIGFFTWLYDLKPAYQEKYGDQRYMSTLYELYLKQLEKEVENGDHLSAFFEWAYNKFPGYREYYGDQGYLAELYNYYLAHNVNSTELTEN